MSAALRTVAFRGQFWAALVLPVALIAGCVLAGGGLILAGLVLGAPVVAAVVVIGPALGRWVGHLRTADDLHLSYPLVTIALWVAVLPVGFLLTASQPVPLDVEPPPGQALANALGAPVVWSVLVLGATQVVLGAIGVRARRRAAPVEAVASPPRAGSGVDARRPPLP
ncbi:hypothetical protein V5D56_07160 [Cellulosimicrobium sp. PMB13]|uniref:hypothetical protein n=1 Tax=Cellulosimicrobium sp. PMB13 TaxID=3120158 RepID=UPI003F4BB038